MATQNNLFALFDVSDTSAIGKRLSETNPAFPILSLPVSSDSWFLVTKSAITTKEVSDAIGVTDGSNGSGIVVRVENYYGRANTAIWEWIVAKRGVIFDAAPE